MEYSIKGDSETHIIGHLDLECTASYSARLWMLNWDALMSSLGGRWEDEDGERWDGVGCGFAARSYSVTPRKSANKHI